MELKVLEWRDPPEIKGRGRKTEQHLTSPFLEVLKSRLGQWALFSIEKDYAGAQKRANYVRQRAKKFNVPVELSIRTIDSKRIEVYIRAV